MEFAAPQLKAALPVVPVMMERRGVSRLGTAEAPGVDWTECAALLTAALPSVHALWAKAAALWMRIAENPNVAQMESVAPQLSVSLLMVGVTAAVLSVLVTWENPAAVKMTSAEEP